MTDYSDDAILNEIRRVAALVSKPKLSKAEFRKHSRVSPDTAAKHFGDWHKALQAAGLGDRWDSSSQPISLEEFLVEIRRVAALIKNPTLSKTEFRKHSRLFSPDTTAKYFGDWKIALQAAGLGERFDSSKQRVSPAEVLAELRRVSEALGVQVFSINEFNSHGRFRHGVVRRVFGTWHKAMKAAGLQTNASGKRYSQDECFENLLQTWTYYGRAPTQDEMRRAPSVVGPSAYVKRFGLGRKPLKRLLNASMPITPRPNQMRTAIRQRPSSETKLRRGTRCAKGQERIYP
jgi:hypothetical protein